MTTNTDKATETPVAGEKNGATSLNEQAHSCAPCFASAASLSALVHFDFLKDAESGEITSASLRNILFYRLGTDEQRKLARRLYDEMSLYGHQSGTTSQWYAAGDCAIEEKFPAYVITKDDLVKLSGMPASITDKLTK